MIKRPVFGLGSPNLRYPTVKGYEKEAVKEIPLPDKVVLFLECPHISIDDLSLKKGDEVRTGERIGLAAESEEYLVSTVTGTIEGVSEYTGYLGRKYAAISIQTAPEDKWDDEFRTVCKVDAGEDVTEFLPWLPGDPDFASLFDSETPLDCIVINGIDKDILVTGNQSIVKTEGEGLKKGIEYLKQISKAERIIIIIPPDLASQALKTGAEVKEINPVYPDALPGMIMKKILGKIVPAGMSCQDMGVSFINAEAVKALAGAFDKGQMPVMKMLTVINKDSSSVNVKVRIGTPVRVVLEALNIQTDHGDRIVLGGPMTGIAIYSDDMPVMADTDAIMVQDSEQIVPSADIPCTNCGECVRACPADIPVNMLVRLLENGLYEEAASEYDLHSCIECGLCAYVCTARIPIFHYIMLGKYEFDRIKSMEGSNV